MAEPTTKPRRRRGAGSIFTDTAGRTRGAIVLVDPDTGRRYRRTVTGTSRGDVQTKLDKLRGAAESGMAPRSGRPLTLAGYVADWLPALRQRVRPATWRAHDAYIRLYLLPALGSTALARLTPSAVERMTAGLLRERTDPGSGKVRRALSPTTARGARTTLRLILRDAERDGLVVRNVAALARPPRLVRRELSVLSADETRRLLDGTEDDDLGPLFALAALTGMRQGELLGLRWQDVDLAEPAPALTVRRALARAEKGYALAEPKTSRSRRTLELAPAAVAALRRRKARQAAERLAAGDTWQDRDGLVFTDTVGRPLRPDDVSHDFRAALAGLRLPHVRFHDLRHGAASLMLAQGVPLKVVSETLGHSGIAITADTYAHLGREQRREAARAMERALGSGR